MTTKNCPYCSEEILSTAKKCKHCGEWLEESKERKGTVLNEKGSSAARGVTKGLKEKQYDDSIFGCGGFLALIVAFGIGVWTESWIIGLILFIIPMIWLTKSYYKE
jgi:hypothetical protein